MRTCESPDNCLERREEGVCVSFSVASAVRSAHQAYACPKAYEAAFKIAVQRILLGIKTMRALCEGEVACHSLEGQAGRDLLVVVVLLVQQVLQAQVGLVRLGLAFCCCRFLLLDLVNLGFGSQLEPHQLQCCIS